MGIETIDVGKSGVAAVVGPATGKVFLLRADMDALPITEDSGVDFPSENGYMHACGHDLHTTMLLGAARLLKHHENELKGRVKLLFQPAEELLTGAKVMVDAGVLENPHVDAAMMIHVLSGNHVENGKFIFLDAGPTHASHDRFEITVTGKGSHGASPELGVDPLLVMSYIHIALGELNSREVPAGEVMIATVGQIKGGLAANVIPQSAYMQGTIRTYKKEMNDLAKRRIKEIAESIGKAYRAEVVVDYNSSCPVQVNDEKLNDAVKKYAEDLFGEEDIETPATTGIGKTTGSEDFSYYSSAVPGIVVRLVANNPSGDRYPMHHPKVVFDDSVLYKGTALLADSAVRWLDDNTI